MRAVCVKFLFEFQIKQSSFVWYGFYVSVFVDVSKATEVLLVLVYLLQVLVIRCI